MASAQGLLRIGAGAGFADDRLDLAAAGAVDYLVFECLVERTTTRENLVRERDLKQGYSPKLLERMEAVLPHCLQHDLRVVTNMGAASPAAGARAPSGRTGSSYVAVPAPKAALTPDLNLDVQAGCGGEYIEPFRPISARTALADPLWRGINWLSA